MEVVVTQQNHVDLPMIQLLMQWILHVVDIMKMYYEKLFLTELSASYYFTHEWQPYTRAMLEATDPSVVNLMTSSDYNFPDIQLDGKTLEPKQK